MIKNDLKKFSEIMASLYTLYKESGSPLLTEIYFNALIEFNLDDISQAISTLIKTRTYQGMPKPGEIYAAMNANKPKIEDIALSQFLVAKKAIVGVSSYQSVRFDDPIIHSVIDSMGGWVEFCMTELNQWHWKEKEFIQRYVRFKEQYDMQELDYTPDFLPGIFATSPSNMREGYKTKVYDVKTNYPCIPVKQIEPRNFMKELSERMKGAKK